MLAASPLLNLLNGNAASSGVGATPAARTAPPPPGGAAAPGFSNLLQQAREHNQRQAERARPAEARPTPSQAPAPRPAAEVQSEPAPQAPAPATPPATAPANETTPTPADSQRAEERKDAREPAEARAATEATGLPWLQAAPELAAAAELLAEAEGAAGDHREAGLEGLKRRGGDAIEPAGRAVEPRLDTAAGVETAGGEAGPSFGEQLEALLGDTTANSAGPLEGPAGVAPHEPHAGALAGPVHVSAEARAETVADTQGTVAVPVESPEFPEALASQVTYLVRDGVQQAKLMLNPVDMGPLTVQIALQGQQAQVDFAASNAATRAALEASLANLAAALQGAGFTLTGGGVSQQASPGQQGSRDDHAATPGGREGGLSAPSQAAGDTGRARRVTQGALDLYA
ncbi:flagellar hook-length control protein FliK [Aquabacterium sp. A7-Y]|uniref:flagellar hook-length control protein FliK n=1 Tax=Aquabacterium sp. A7-Y TaxID=1349605 RepID=UPI00223CA90C|nr:flagellar hook-length control protein FliK [Aquabacterium sp. A7-Y]MCW7540555.1 flagellar hook-length control protein FliK [Aquabacterium sp. A7-Y]